MFIAVDIGNSNIVLGIHNGEAWHHLWRWETHLAEAELYYSTQIADVFLEAGISLTPHDTIGLSSVVPDLTKGMRTALEKLFEKEVLVLDPREVLGIRISPARASEIGSDLVANAIAGFHRFPEGCLIVDFGTALTFTVVSSQGEVIGANILPGLKTAIRSLFGNTARLPEVPIELPASKIGKDTITAIQSGVLWGYTGLVREMIRMIREESGQAFPVVATGGLSAIMGPVSSLFDEINPHLTLDGIRLELDPAGGT